MNPVAYTMLDLKGLDLANVKGQTYPGLYNSIYSAMNSCQEIILCNWFVADILIPPTYCWLDIDTDGVISINDMIFIYSNDTIEIPTMGTTPKIIALSVTGNGTYVVPDGYDGFNPVEVEVLPELQSKTVTENGEVVPDSGYYGLSTVVVNVQPPLQSIVITEDGVYTPPPGYYGFSQVEVSISNKINMTVSISGGYNGGASVKIHYNGAQVFSATGSSPYNSSYSPSSGTFVIDGETVSVTIPNLPTTTSPFSMTISTSVDSATVTFMHEGRNTSYGYGEQQTTIQLSKGD